MSFYPFSAKAKRLQGSYLCPLLLDKTMHSRDNREHRYEKKQEGKYPRIACTLLNLTLISLHRRTRISSRHSHRRLDIVL